MLTVLTDFFNENGRPPRVRDLKDNKPQPKTIRTRFGSWEEALIAAGLDSSNQRQEYSDDYLLNLLRGYKNTYGYPPSSSDVDKVESYPSASLYTTRFGSYEKALSLAGLQRKQRKDNLYSDEVLLQKFEEVCKHFERQPSYSEYEDYASQQETFPSIKTIRRRLGNLKTTARKLGHIGRSDKNGLSKEFLIEEMLRFNNRYGRPPINTDFDGSYKDFPSRRSYINAFGSFGEALVAAGFKYRGIGSSYMRDKPLPDGVETFTKELVRGCVESYVQEHGVVPTMEAIEKTPNFPIRTDFRNLFGSYNEVLVEFGLTPNTREYSDEELK